MALVVLYSTHPDLAQARATADALLTARLIACCNLITGIESHYHWQGARGQAQEVAMICKTTADAAEAATALIRAHHPYDCPAIAHWPAKAGHEGLLDWLRASVETP